MNKAIIIGLIILVLVGVGLYIYYFYEVPINEAPRGLAEVNIIASDKGKDVITNYTIATGDISNIYSIGTTIKGFYKERVPVNSTVYIYNVNIDNQTYYTDLVEVNSFKEDPFRVRLELKQRGNLTFTSDPLDSENITVNVKSDGLFKDLHFCYKWSNHFITVKNEQYEQIDKIDSYKLYDRCYKFGESLGKNSKDIVLTTKTFGTLDKDDSIRFIFFDKDDVLGFDNNKNVGYEIRLNQSN